MASVIHICLCVLCFMFVSDFLCFDFHQVFSQIQIIHSQMTCFVSVELHAVSVGLVFSLFSFAFELNIWFGWCWVCLGSVWFGPSLGCLLLYGNWLVTPIMFGLAGAGSVLLSVWFGSSLGCCSTLVGQH